MFHLIRVKLLEVINCGLLVFISLVWAQLEQRLFLQLLRGLINIVFKFLLLVLVLFGKWMYPEVRVFLESHIFCVYGHMDMNNILHKGRVIFSRNPYCEYIGIT